MKALVVQHPSGSITVVYPSYLDVGLLESETEYIARVISRNRAVGHISLADVVVGTVERDTVPRDRIFREAWAADLTVDMPKARLIHMNRIRVERDKELKRLDMEWSRKTAQGDTVGAANAEADRQRMRDLPQTFDLASATTPEALKARWPAGLSRP
jgi:hypothetical protein